jgi:hypothetical protein
MVTQGPGFAILLLLLPCIAIGQAAKPTQPNQAEYDFRYGIPPGEDLASLLDKPRLMSMTVEKLRDPASGEPRIIGQAEAEAVYDIPFKALAALFEDPAGALSYSPRLLEAKNEERTGSRMVMTQVVGISFLGLKVGYRYRTDQVRDDISPTEVGYRLHLLESLDGKLFEAYSSVYAKEVIVAGRRLVYLRVYSRPGIRNPFLGMELVIRSFTPGELTSILDRAAKGARRLAERPE